ncbi:N-acetylglucosamine-6-phosphate deacetylase [Paracoccus sp. IB05]|uniref:N-acetylglucosamine-6-phosphate deacetylase n=1 Tax=Paracoccus sp. IB05 TaxID=2779367 RepID=UPI0018E77FAA|nr:N-acetylglucosamine-6-phosphate deacetylase [Paracoccus sp. IB05]MBJ2150019.1 N-acetylglucosamine-6-phosphate deacetylase [Paracoccus sp. IB05]
MGSGTLHAGQIFDGETWHQDAAISFKAGRITAIGPSGAAPRGPRLPGLIAPGYIDLQVNGGGGVLFNNDPTPEGIATICAAHAQLGTTAVMVTLITDRPDITGRAVAAAEAARAPGFLGLHLEGPHLSLTKKGTHDPALIRVMQDQDLAAIRTAAGRLPHLIVTLAPESVTPDQVRALAAAGVTVSLGHSDCDYDTARDYIAAGARMVTHLFNAMSQLGHRAPGLVGAALVAPGLYAGLIADGFHVADAAMQVALRAKPGEVFLVSDAMSTIGSDLTGFMLNGREIFRAGGRLTLADGTLAGADIALSDAVRYCHLRLGLDKGAALRLGSAAPAAALGLTDRGHLRPGARADLICLDDALQVLGCWIAGTPSGGIAAQETRS